MQSPPSFVTSSLISPNILLNIMFSNTLSRTTVGYCNCRSVCILQGFICRQQGCSKSSTGYPVSLQPKAKYVTPDSFVSGINNIDELKRTQTYPGTEEPRSDSWGLFNRLRPHRPPITQSCVGELISKCEITELLNGSINMATCDVSLNFLQFH